MIKKLLKIYKKKFIYINYNNKMNNKEYKCDICSKTYSSYQSFWNHNKKFHKVENNYKCNYCDKSYKQQPSKSRHEKTCKYKNININFQKNIDLINTINELKNDIDKIKNNKININNNPNINSNNDEYSYIYLLKCFDINANKINYKIGRTSRDIKKRVCEYSKSYKTLLTIYVPNSVEIEKYLLNILKNDNKIYQNKEMGTEYFCCDDYVYIYSIVLNTIHNKIINNEINNKTENIL